MIDKKLSMFVASGKFLSATALAPATCHLLPAPAGPDFLSAVWEQSPGPYHLLFKPFLSSLVNSMRIGIDIGGTFTDFVFIDEDSGQFHTFKRLSTATAPEQAVLTGLQTILDLRPLSSDLRIVHGSTVATNALLERKGARTALITTRGFKDILTIGRQNRSAAALYDFFVDRPQPLIPSQRCFEITERVDHRGRVLEPLVETELTVLIEELGEAGVESVAVSLLFSFLHPEHEQKIAEMLRGAGFFVSISSDILPEFREYERSSTTAINAFVSPIMDRYLGRLSAQLSSEFDKAMIPAAVSVASGPSTSSSLRIMQSNGGMIQAELARSQAVHCILSGPAGGAVGALYVAQNAGFDRILSFDMGGTSTDVSLLDGDLSVTSETEIGGLPIRIPVIDIHTVGAGGGSIGHVDAGGALRVGPHSAGADPGPACYGKVGTFATVTDANLVLGRLTPDHFLGGAMRLDIEAAEFVLAELARQAHLESHNHLSAAQTAALGVIQIANAHMERALRVISVERGFDPADFALASFGGAGGLHACDLARSLGIRRLLIPPQASVLSAFGMLAADVVKDYVQTVMIGEDSTYADLEQNLAPLLFQAQIDLEAEGIPSENMSLHPLLDMRYRGQSFEITIPLSPDLIAVFHAEHERVYGHAEPSAPVEIVNVRVRAVGLVTSPSLPESGLGDIDPAHALLEHRPMVLSSGQLLEVPFYEGVKLQPGCVIPGPAVIVQKDTTVYMPDSIVCSMDKYFNLVVREL